MSTNAFILTDAPNPGYAYSLLRDIKADGLVIVPEWGLDWTSLDTRALMLSATCDTFLRTSYGDPGRDEHRDRGEYKYTYLYPETLVELDIFLKTKPHARVILGNEPNLEHVDIWVYRYYLFEAIRYMRAKYPQVELISPAPTVDPKYVSNVTNYYITCRDAILQCDYIGIHAYDVSSFLEPTTNQLEIAIGLARKHLGYTKKLALTEYGLNSMILTQKGKLAQYSRMQTKYIKLAFCCAFHISQGKEFPFYNINKENV